MKSKFLMQKPFLKHYIEEIKESDFVEIYKTIKTHYPINTTSKNERTKELESFKETNSIIRDSLQDKNTFKKWSDYLVELKKYFPNQNISGNSSLQPGYGGIIEIKRNTQIQGVIISKELHVYKSLLGKYYTIFGVDEVKYFDGAFYYMRFDPIITISPLNEYKTSFDLLKKKMKETFPDYKFIPFMFGTLKVKGLSTIYSERENGDSTINEALFMNHDYGSYNYIGDLRYGYEDFNPGFENRRWSGSIA